MALEEIAKNLHDIISNHHDILSKAFLYTAIYCAAIIGGICLPQYVENLIKRRNQDKEREKPYSNSMKDYL